MEILFKPEKSVKYFVYILIFLISTHLISQYIIHFIGHNYRFLRIFDLGWEQSIPSLFVTIEWLLGLFLLAVITTVKKNEGSYLYWLGLVITFSYLTLDEAVSIHERLSNPIRSLLKLSGLLYYAWIIPYSIALFIFFLIYLRFIISLPYRTRILIITGGVLFLIGALGLEIFEGKYIEVFDRNRLYHLFYITLEESLEMIGLGVFIYALMTYIDLECKGTRIGIKSSKG
ncbi:MAG: hypothetical protein SWO11_07150 [Thermodesulfobacteriota bacterium]|nr:hypothetical protein [Thermodesulfobacteriota bacterium]